MTRIPAYSHLDRILHHLAFAAIEAQKALADIEDRVFGAMLSGASAARPVFVTSLPRAGTTLLFEILAALPNFASHTYRYMPLVLCPLVWNRLSRRFRRRGEARERAHGDGMSIDYDSAEAFEEIIWRAFWARHYRADRIIPWSAADRDDEFEGFFRTHMVKVVALQSATNRTLSARRYVSKNNANIARLDLLTALFPDCRIVIPVRNPRDQIASLRRQHSRFLQLHAADPFSRRYMEWIGHFEFGQALRPIDFGGWMGEAVLLDGSTEEFWGRYWIAAYDAVLAAAGPNVLFFDYDRACREPRPMLRALAQALDIDSAADFLEHSGRFRAATRYEARASPGNTELDARAQKIYERAIGESLAPVGA